MSKEYVSGQELSRRLGISRTAVWKRIQTLKSDGYKIDSKIGKGYILIKMNEQLTPERIRLVLPESPFTRKIIHYAEIDSTNLAAKKLGDQGHEEGVLIIAEKQLQGRGRLGRPWDSDEKGLWFSILLRPNIAPFQAPQLSLLAAAAMQKTLHEKFLIEAKIKWPNDLMVNHKKICGILTEMRGEVDQVNYVVLGVGINVNQEKNDFSKEIKDIATSLRISSGSPVDRAQLLKEFLQQLELFYVEYLENGFAKTRKACVEHSHTIGNSVKLYSGNEEYQGAAVDLSQEGALILEINGKSMVFHSGEISMKPS